MFLSIILNYFISPHFYNSSRKKIQKCGNWSLLRSNYLAKVTQREKMNLTLILFLFSLYNLFLLLLPVILKYKPSLQHTQLFHISAHLECFCLESFCRRSHVKVFGSILSNSYYGGFCVYDDSSKASCVCEGYMPCTNFLLCMYHAAW
jgi:hypothetical protein